MDTHGTRILHRPDIEYPAGALARKLEGAVTVQVRLDQAGNVIEASVLSGPDEFRHDVLKSVLDWHFSKEAALSEREVTVSFDRPNSPVIPDVRRVTTGEKRTQSIPVADQRLWRSTSRQSLNSRRKSCCPSCH